MASVFGSLGNFASTSAAASDLGMLGGNLADQVASETDEERKKRLRLQALQNGPGSVLNSLSVQSLFGNYGR